MLEQLGVEQLAALFHAIHHGLQLVHHLGQGMGLLLQCLEGFLALVHQRKRSQHGVDGRVQPPHHIQPFTAADGRHQAQHGRRGHTHHRRTKGQAQALDGCGQCRANGLQVGRAFQRKHGALEGHHHAQEGAQHAQHHQQADQVRRERRAGQGDTFTLHPRAHGVLQRRVQTRQPVAQVVGCCVQLGECLCQRGRGRAELLQLPRTRHVHPGNHQRHGQGQPAGAEEARTHPGHSRQAKDKGRHKKALVVIHVCLCVCVDVVAHGFHQACDGLHTDG